MKNEHPIGLLGFDQRTISSVLKDRYIVSYGCYSKQSFKESWRFQLSLNNGVVLEFWSNPVFAVGWEEVGVLCVRLESVALNCGLIENEWRAVSIQPFFVKKVVFLVDERTEFRAECGLTLINEKEEEFIVVTGIPPGSVTISAPFNRNDFDPENHLHTYKREGLGAR